jgi:hypothetical protein
MIASPPIAIAYMESYYAESMTHANYYWVLKILIIMGAFIGCGICEAEMGGSTLGVSK